MPAIPAVFRVILAIKFVRRSRYRSGYREHILLEMPVGARRSRFGRSCAPACLISFSGTEIANGGDEAVVNPIRHHAGPNG